MRGIYSAEGFDDLVFMTGSYITTRPVAVSTEMTPTASGGAPGNTKGAWTEIVSDTLITRDVYGVELWPSWNNIAGEARNCMLDLGADPTGGTSYSVLIPNVCASMASRAGGFGGMRFFFPIFIRAGTALAIRAQVGTSLGGGTVGCGVHLYGAPADRVLIRPGTYATNFGSNTGTSLGTTCTPGTASEGAWTSLATNISRPHWWWQTGLSIDDTSITTGGIYHVDLAYGDASNKHIIIEDQMWFIPSANEEISGIGMQVGCQRYVPAGSNIYARVQRSNTTADTSVGVWAIAVGG